MSGGVETLIIDRLGPRGEGVAQGLHGAVEVPYALAGETVEAEISGARGKLLRVLAASADRIASICPHYGVCGGCALRPMRFGSAVCWLARWRRRASSRRSRRSSPPMAKGAAASLFTRAAMRLV